MTATTSPLLQALAAVKEARRRCHVGTILDSLSEAERDAYEQALEARVAIFPVLAQILTESTGKAATKDQVRHHANKECRCDK